MSPNPDALVAGVITITAVAVAVIVAGLAVYGAFILCLKASGWAEDTGADRADRRAWNGDDEVILRDPMPERAFLERREPLEDPQPDDLTICRDIARRGTATHRNTRKDGTQ